MSVFDIKSEYKPSGDQPKAIKELLDGFKAGKTKGTSQTHETLLGVTGSGKTFTAANIIQEIGKPTLVIAHNKTLAAQLAQEYREFFPNNAVHYFVSYYDYYQPEAYMPVSDTYIEKEAMINEEIDRLRHATTQALLTRKDVIIVSSVSCIYGLGSPDNYEKVNMRLEKGKAISRADLIRNLIRIHFERTTADLLPGMFRSLGNTVEIMPVSERYIIRIVIGTGTDIKTKKESSEVISSVTKIDGVTRRIMEEVDGPVFVFPAKHFISDDEQKKKAIESIKSELKEQLKKFEKEGKILEAERLKRRTTYDLALIKEVGYCNGIENYSRHFSGHQAGDPPDTLLSYFPHKKDGTPDFLTIIDESHVTVSQIGGMYAGDASRKENLVEHGFRLPSARDNRPLKFEEFQERIGQVLYTTATPSAFEIEHSTVVAEQIIRPTGLIDPIIDIKPVVEKGNYKGQIQDFIEEAEKAIKHGDRVIATTLTKKMAEDLSVYLKEKGMKAEYLHSDIKTIDRIDILTAFRRGDFDCLVGINLLREGLDLPEVALIGILDADKEGFLRSETSLIQIIGRAARNVFGRVILYADTITGSMDRAMKETERRRKIQLAYNEKHGITPKTILKKIKDITEEMRSDHDKAVTELALIDAAAYAKDPKAVIKEKREQMEEAVKNLDFETAAILRDEIQSLEGTTPKRQAPRKRR